MACTLSETLAGWLRAGFLGAFPDGDSGVIVVTPSGKPEHGDYQCNAAMALAKARRMPPREVAAQLLQHAGTHPIVARAEVVGPGFINIFLHTEALLAHLDAMAVSPDTLGIPPIGAGRTVVVDYSSPNVAKPMHIGHIRSTIIGAALDRLHRALGYRVISDNHIGDWGTQFGILIRGYREFADAEALRTEPVEELERIYVKSYEHTRNDPAWLDACRAELVKLQAGDPENRRLWEQFVQWSLKAFDRIYARLGVRFDLVRGESFYHDRLAGVLARLQAHDLLRESEGAQVVFLEEEGLPVCLVRKSDGGYNYATTDLATVESRLTAFAPEAIVYVTDERQQLHFRQIFAIARKLGCPARLEHVWFGLMRLPDATFSTRQGNVIRLERLLDEAERRALEIVQAASPRMDPETQREIARAVGIGAVKYADLSQNPQTMITFTWEKALALDGNSGPYLQYAYARIASLRDKYTERVPEGRPESAPWQLTEAVERELALQVARFPEAVLRAAQAYRPSVIADYLYALAQTYSTFYQNVPVLKADDAARDSRVRLCGMVGQVLRRGLDLLGIETPPRI